MSTAPCLMWRSLSATQVTCCALVGPDVVWPGESSGNYLSSPPGTSHPRCVARCTWPVSALLCSTVVKCGDRMPLMFSGSATMTMRRSAGYVALKSKTKNPKLQKLGIEDITAVLRCQQLRWSGHVQHAASCIKSVTDLVIPYTRRRVRPRKTWSKYMKNDVRECGLSGIDP